MIIELRSGNIKQKTSRAAIELALRSKRDVEIRFGETTAPFNGKSTMTLDSELHLSYATKQRPDRPERSIARG